MMSLLTNLSTLGGMLIMILSNGDIRLFALATISLRCEGPMSLALTILSSSYLKSFLGPVI